MSNELQILADRFQSTRPIRGATIGIIPYLQSKVFQSTRPIRGATWAIFLRLSHSSEFQSTRPIRGATSYTHADISVTAFQSTRPIRGATIELLRSCVDYLFQSTRPIRGATGGSTDTTPKYTISIHAPHTGRDVLHTHGMKCCGEISIHAPHTGRDLRYP